LQMILSTFFDIDYDQLLQPESKRDEVVVLG
jgi:hypothetical protein